MAETPLGYLFMSIFGSLVTKIQQNFFSEAAKNGNGPEMIRFRKPGTGRNADPCNQDVLEDSGFAI